MAPLPQFMHKINLQSLLCIRDTSRGCGMREKNYEVKCKAAEFCSLASKLREFLKPQFSVKTPSDSGGSKGRGSAAASHVRGFETGVDCSGE